MIPAASIDSELVINEEIETSKTYSLSDTKIQGMGEQLEALKQAIYKVLTTEKYEHPIYSFQYGIELQNLVGKDITYVKMELVRRIQECLIQDERISSVENFSFTVNGDEMLCTFDVNSIYGKVIIGKEVSV
ncbi:DUF2634 domain-containing protein [Anaeromicropila populeti]|uniref:DUF2634 domain-containing protein n=1 Tax=Anaeromicropila populeti TaxID=37658 RepID=A0A1I6JID5_9FIRM|nr:DUF2634 domain-containing protein [Anaeromicropila populeti]SFR78639.1 Protein of unknown function [Anaeromicropila populeti]